MLGLLASTLALAGLASSAPLRVPRAAHANATSTKSHKPEDGAAPWFVYYADRGAGSSIPDPSSLGGGWNVFALSFWLTSGPRDYAATWANLGSDQQQATIQSYHNAGIKIIVSAFGETDAPTGQDPSALGTTLGQWVAANNLDGVDVDYEDHGAMTSGAAIPWLQTFTTALRAALPAGAILSHAPLAPWFTSDKAAYPQTYLDLNNAVGGSIDFYNLQYYNDDTAYTTCDSLITNSASSSVIVNNHWEQTAILELVSNGVPASKLVLGKPGQSPDAPAGGYMDEGTLAQCVSQARQAGWNGGLMVWEYPDAPAGYISTVWGN